MLMNKFALVFEEMTCVWIDIDKGDDNFIAVQMSGTKSKWTKTELEAEEYINRFLCEPNCGVCRAEWDILTREEYDDLEKVSN